MDAREKYRRHLRIEEYLDNEEFQIKDFRLSDLAEGEGMEFHWLLILCDIGRGFPYVMAMPWACKAKPDYVDFVFYMGAVRDRYENSPDQQPSIQLDAQYQQLSESGFLSHLDELCGLAKGDRL